MSTRHAADATRQGAVFAAIVALHVAALAMVARSLGVLPMPLPEEWAPVFAVPPAPQPVSVSRPDPLTVPDYTAAPVQAPDLDIRVIRATETGSQDGASAEPGEGASPARPEP